MTSPEELAPYLALAAADIARLVLCLIVEDELRRRLALFRPEDTLAQPVQRLEKLGV